MGLLPFSYEKVVLSGCRLEFYGVTMERDYLHYLVGNRLTGFVLDFQKGELSEMNPKGGKAFSVEVELLPGRSVSWEQTLYDDESTREKWLVMSKTDIVNDDVRNELPQEKLTELENFLQFGQKYRVCIRESLEISCKGGLLPN